MNNLIRKNISAVCVLHLATMFVSSFYVNSLGGVIYAIWLIGCIVLAILLVRAIVQLARLPSAQTQRVLSFTVLWLVALFGMQWAGASLYRVAFPFLHKSGLTNVLNTVNPNSPDVRIISRNPLQIHIYRESFLNHSIYIYATTQPSAFYVGRSSLRVESLGDNWYRVMLTPFIRY